MPLHPGNNIKEKLPMKTKILLASLLMVTLAACSLLPAQAQTTANQSGQQNPISAGITEKTPIESKLALGILKLEGTNLAVTADEAKTLLPLWKGLKALESSNTTAPEELTALYQQIQAAMTPEQVQAIQKMTLSQADLQTMMKNLGIQFGGPGGGTGQSTLTASQRATRTAGRTQGSQGGGGGFAGPPQGGGGFGGPPQGGGNQGGFGGGDFGGNGTTNTSRTPVPGQTANRGGGFGIGRIFVDPVIKLLTTRAGA
jgi:hypothetical protein